ncbi:MAG: TetR family transcriptional regulator C-terminal domain-containing protein [Dermatophilaceae bacterium]
MPKLVDHELRGTEITEAAWRVLVRGGVRAVSVRNVAGEAGLATASLRRVFPTQSALLAACLLLVRDRVATRVVALPRSDDPVETAVAALCETLPLDDTRRLEMQVFLILGTAALADPQLRAAYQAVSSDLVHLCAAVVEHVQPDRPADRRQQETTHLYALVDGLALHTLHGDDPALAHEALRTHLSRLAGRLPPPRPRGASRPAGRQAR